MTLYIQIPIKACHGCGESYDLEEWRLLPLLDMRSEPCQHTGEPCSSAHVIERRKCGGRNDRGERCITELTLDVSATERLDTEVTVEEYLAMHPTTTRHYRRAYEKRPPRSRWTAVGALVAMVVVAVLVALVASSWMGAR